MNSRIWIAGGAIAIVGVLAGGWFLGTEPLLAQAATSDAERASVEQLNLTQEARLAQLEELDDRLPELQDEAAQLRVALPADAAMAAFLGELNAMAGEAKVQIVSLSAAGAEPIGGAADAATDPAAADGAAESTESTDAAATAEEAPVPTGFAGISALPISLSVTGGLDELNSFLDRLHKGERLMTVSITTLAADSAGAGFRLELSGAVYVQPAAAPAA